MEQRSLFLGELLYPFTNARRAYDHILSDAMREAVEGIQITLLVGNEETKQTGVAQNQASFSVSKNAYVKIE